VFVVEDEFTAYSKPIQRQDPALVEHLMVPLAEGRCLASPTNVRLNG